MLIFTDEQRLRAGIMGELSNGPRGWNPPKEGAASRDGLWMGTLVSCGACTHRCCAD